MVTKFELNRFPQSTEIGFKIVVPNFQQNILNSFEILGFIGKTVLLFFHIQGRHEISQNHLKFYL